jgi:GMP synthase (glutamine-hydrolysing)
MHNHRFITSFKNSEEFVSGVVQFLEKFAKDKKVFLALSGGVDSTAVYLLLKHAKINTLPVFIDHGLMRIINGMEEREYIKKYFPDAKIVDIRESFLPKIYLEGDAENKRKLFKNGYSEIISKTIIEENCDLLADGTILPDIEESFGVKITDIKETLTLQEELDLKDKYNKGFVKSQHNLDIEYDVEATIQPVASLTKPEIREVLKFFKMPQEIIYRKAFPGPALAARIIGPISPENLGFEKQVHDIVESKINEYYIKKYGKSMIINDKGEQEPFQMFAAISEDILNKKVTGLVNGQRTYDFPLAVYGKWNYEYLNKIATKFTGYTRMFYEIMDCKKGVYDVVIRSVNSIDARTASVTNLPFDLITSIAEKLAEIPRTKRIYFDMTPKPPGTIEYV